MVHLYLLSCLKRCIWNCLPLCSLLFCSASWMLSRLYCNQEFTSASWMHQKKDGEAGRSCGMSLFCCYLLQEARLQHITYLQFLCYLYFNQWWRKETPLKRLSHLTKTSLVNSVVSECKNNGVVTMHSCDHAQQLMGWTNSLFGIFHQISNIPASNPPSH